MVKFERFVQYIQTTLQRTFAEVEYIPRRGMNPPQARAKLPVRLELEPVFEIRMGADKKPFISSFYILNHKLAGHYGITADDPCAVHYGTCGDFDEKLPHIQEALLWLDNLTENPGEIPEERKFDPVTELLKSIDKSVLKPGWYRSFPYRGNYLQMLGFPGNEDYEGSMEVYFSDGCWHLFFEWLSKHEDAPRRFDLDYKTRCLKADLSEIAKTLSRILQDPPASPPKN